jgi:hypothetical protein
MACLSYFAIFPGTHIRVYCHDPMTPGSPHPTSESISRFHSASVPQISILDYLRRIVRFTNLEVCLFSVRSLSTVHSSIRQNELELTNYKCFHP